MTIKTSATHPLQIAAIKVAPGKGQIGITFCPGKTQPSAYSGRWERDLSIDVKAIADWNCAAVLTLIEEHEIRDLEVTDLETQVRQQQMIWRHAPIRDVTAPGPDFEERWQTIGPQLVRILDLGFNVLIHCKGGLGRAGTVAARLLTQFGWSPADAICEVRRVRPGALETQAQEDYVHSAPPLPDGHPSTSAEAIRDRAIGSLLGLAVGDALGTTLEFQPRDTYPYLTDMIGGGPFQLEAGQWTDDTSMALALADSLLHDPALDAADLMRRFASWMDKGLYSSTGHCFDIGITTRSAITRWKRTGNPIAGSTDPNSAGNGSLMRLAPIAICHYRDPAALRYSAGFQSRTTHGADEAIDACVFFADLLAEAINGTPISAIFRERAEPFAGTVRDIALGAWRGKARAQIKSSGYVAHSLEAALWAVARTGSFAEAVLLAANLGDDADTTAAITGQLAGALYGASAIPAHLLQRLYQREDITKIANALFDAGSSDFPPASDRIHP